MEGQLLALLSHPGNLVIMAGAWALLSTARQMFPRVAAHSISVRLMPVLPILVCSAEVWLPGLSLGVVGAGDRVLLGIVLGFATGHGFKVAAQSLLGKDARLATPPEPGP